MSFKASNPHKPVMCFKTKLRRGDRVIVKAGRDKGLSGVILKILLSENRALVSGVNKVAHHQKASAQNPESAILWKESPIHLSNLSFLDPQKNESSRLGYRFESGQKVRFSKKSGSTIPTERSSQ